MGDCEQSVKMPETEGTFRIASLTVSGASAGPRASTADQQEVASLEAPFTVHIKGDAGFVWCSDDARLLRRRCRIVGCMIGGLAGFRQQVSVNGLPLQLSPEEVTLASSKGWITLVPDRCELTCGTEQVPLNTEHAAPSKYFKPPAKKKKNAQKELNQWEKEVNQGLTSIPVAKSSTSTETHNPEAQVQWEYPRDARQQLHYCVFADLHHRGYTMTSGAKFGADYLAYPGDPTLYHAQFAVRVLDWESPMHPYGFAAGTRTAHAARKHLLLATAQQSAPQPSASSGGLHAFGEVVYFSVAPDVFQSSNKRKFVAAPHQQPTIPRS